MIMIMDTNTYNTIYAKVDKEKIPLQEVIYMKLA